MSRWFPLGNTKVIRKDGKCFQYIKNSPPLKEVEAPDGTGFTSCKDCKGSISSVSFSSSSPASSSSSPVSSSSEPIENACIDNSCPTVDGFTNPPDIQLTVTADDVSLPINFCGKTWIKSTEFAGPGEYFSGQTACICPSRYLLLKRSTQNTSVSHTVKEQWRKNNTASSLHLYRAWRIVSYFSASYFNAYDHWMNIANPISFEKDSRSYKRRKRTSTDTRYSVAKAYSLNAGMNTTDSQWDATKSDYRLVDAQFGSFTSNGVTYSWDRGLRW